MDHSHSHALRGESSKPIRYNPVPIGGPDRPPLTQSPASPGSIQAASSASPGRRNNHAAERRNHSLNTDLARPAVKREPGGRDGPDYQSEPPPSAVTDYTERSSSVYPESGGNGVRSDDGDAEDGPQKKRQKRNKPTLSCFECVERKTKVRPAIFSYLVTVRCCGALPDITEIQRDRCCPWSLVMLADIPVYFDASPWYALRDYTYPRLILTYGLNIH